MDIASSRDQTIRDQRKFGEVTASPRGRSLQPLHRRRRRGPSWPAAAAQLPRSWGGRRGAGRHTWGCPRLRSMRQQARLFSVAAAAAVAGVGLAQMSEEEHKPGYVVELTADSFDEVVANSRPILVDFYA